MSIDFQRPSFFASSSPQARRSRALAALALVVIFCLPTVTFADDNVSRVGQKIMIKDAGTWIGHTDEFGRQVYVAELTDMVFKVLNEQNGWLQVRQRGVEGWFVRERAVLLEDALSFFAQRIQTNNGDAFALAHRGRAWKEEGELEKALRDLDEAIRIDPYSSAWFSNRGMVYDELHEYDLAIRDYGEALRRDPRSPLTHNNRGMAYKAKKDYDQAIRDYSTAIRLDPRWSDPYFNRGNAFKAKTDYDQAVRDYTEAIRRDPEEVPSTGV